MERVRMGGVISTSNTQSLLFALQNWAVPQPWALFPDTCRTPSAYTTMCYPAFSVTLPNRAQVSRNKCFFYFQDCWWYINKTIWPLSSPQGTNLKVCPHDLTGLISNRSTSSISVSLFPTLPNSPYALVFEKDVWSTFWHESLCLGTPSVCQSERESQPTCACSRCEWI